MVTDVPKQEGQHLCCPNQLIKLILCISLSTRPSILQLHPICHVVIHLKSALERKRLNKKFNLFEKYSFDGGGEVLEEVMATLLSFNTLKDI